MPQIEWKIDAGHIITIVMLIAAISLSWGSLNTKIDLNANALLSLQVQVESIRATQIQVLQDQAHIQGKLEEHDREDTAWREAHPSVR